MILTVANNTSGVCRGLHKPNFTLNVKDLDTRDKVLHVESAQFEVHFENIDEARNKRYVVHREEEEDRLSIKTGTNSDIDDLVSMINATLNRAGHGDIVFSYSRHTSRISGSLPRTKRYLLKKDSPGLVLGVGVADLHIDICLIYIYLYLCSTAQFVRGFGDLCSACLQLI